MRKLIYPILAAVVLLIVSAAPTFAWSPDISRACGTEGRTQYTVTLHADTSAPAAYTIATAEEGVLSSGPYVAGDVKVVQSAFAITVSEVQGDQITSLTAQPLADCPAPSPTPSPSPSPTPSPSATPSATPTASVVPTPPILPPTDTSPTDFPNGSAWLILLGAVIIAGVVVVTIVRDER